jgi:hypothetical protein
MFPGISLENLPFFITLQWNCKISLLTLIIDGLEQFLFMIELHNREGRVMRTKGAAIVRRAGTVLRRRPMGFEGRAQSEQVEYLFPF